MGSIFCSYIRIGLKIALPFRNAMAHKCDKMYQFLKC